MRKVLNLALVLTLTLTAALAQQPSTGIPSVNRLQEIIAYVASDALEGRRTGTPGANDAAHYIAGEFSLLGLRPACRWPGPRALAVKSARVTCNHFRTWRKLSWARTTR